MSHSERCQRKEVVQLEVNKFILIVINVREDRKSPPTRGEQHLLHL